MPVIGALSCLECRYNFFNGNDLILTSTLIKLGSVLLNSVICLSGIYIYSPRPPLFMLPWLYTALGDALLFSLR